MIDATDEPKPEPMTDATDDPALTKKVMTMRERAGAGAIMAMLEGLGRTPRRSRHRALPDPPQTAEDRQRQLAAAEVKRQRKRARHQRIWREER